MLDRVLAEAAHATGNTADGPVQTVVTCPVSWASARREVLLAAAPAGTRLVDGPVAAAHYFTDVAGTHVAVGGSAVIYDFGAGTFDAAVVRRTATGFTTLAALGLPDCGGLDVDAAIVAHLAAAGYDAALWGRLDSPQTATDRRARQ